MQTRDKTRTIQQLFEAANQLPAFDDSEPQYPPPEKAMGEADVPIITLSLHGVQMGRSHHPTLTLTLTQLEWADLITQLALNLTQLGGERT